MTEQPDLIQPYLNLVTEGHPTDHGWYAVDKFGAGAGPYATREQAEAKLRTVYPATAQVPDVPRLSAVEQHYADRQPPQARPLSQKERFELWAKFKCPQFNPAGRTVAGGKWVYHHNIQQLLWECWQDKPDAPPPDLFVPSPNRVMHDVLNYQQNLRTNVTGTTNWAANIGMVVVNLIEKMNPKVKFNRV